MNVTGYGPADPVDKRRVLDATGDPTQIVPGYTLKVTVPVGLKPAVTVAESAAGLPTMMDPVERPVLTEGTALDTVKGSDSQGLETALLLASPLYVACQVYDPAWVKLIVIGPAEPADIVAVLVAYGAPVHVVPGYTKNVTVPVGRYPPLIEAVSEVPVPTVIVELVRDVLTVGVAFVMVSISVPHVLDAGALLLSPV